MEDILEFLSFNRRDFIYENKLFQIAKLLVFLWAQFHKQDKEFVISLQYLRVSVTHQSRHILLYLDYRTTKILVLNPLSVNPTNGQTHSSNSLATAEELFDVLDHFVGWRLKG